MSAKLQAIVTSHYGASWPHPEPHWLASRDGIAPHCALDDCRSFDGKRCEILGHRPESLCEPAVIAVVASVVVSS